MPKSVGHPTPFPAKKLCESMYTILPNSLLYDRTTDIQRAINECAAEGGGTVHLPTGSYPVTHLTLPGAVILYGTNPYATTLLSLIADQDVLTVVGRGSRVCNIGFKSTLPRTAGRYLYLTPTSRATYVDNFLMEGAFIGVGINTGATCYLEHGEIINGSSLPSSAGIQVEQGYDLSISHVLMDNPADQQPAAGIHVVNSGDLRLFGCNIIHCTNDLLINGGFSIYATDCFFDTAATGILIDAQTPVERCHFHGCWTSSHTGHGMLIASNSPSSIDTIDFQGHHSFFNGNDGIHIGKGNNIKVQGSSCCNNLSGSGIGVGSLAQHVLLTGNRCGDTSSMDGNGYGIYLIEGCDHLILCDNDLTGNQHAPLIKGVIPHLILANNLI